VGSSRAADRVRPLFEQIGKCNAGLGGHRGVLRFRAVCNPTLNQGPRWRLPGSPTGSNPRDDRRRLRPSLVHQSGTSPETTTQERWSQFILDPAAFAFWATSRPCWTTNVHLGRAPADGSLIGEVYRINDKGQSVGTLITSSGDYGRHAVLYDGDDLVDLRLVPHEDWAGACQRTPMNQHPGQIVGAACGADVVHRLPRDLYSAEWWSIYIHRVIHHKRCDGLSTGRWVITGIRCMWEATCQGFVYGGRHLHISREPARWANSSVGH